VPAWKEAYERLTELDRASTLDPEQLFELAMSAYLVGKDAESFTTLVRAQQGFVHRRQFREAGGVAARIALISMGAGDAAQAAGWMARAARLLDESGEPCAERGHLLLAAARQALIAANVDDARAKFAEAAGIGERFGDVDLTNLARQGLGRTLIELGDIEHGVGLLDEVMVAVTSGEVSTIIAGVIYCSVLSACWDLSDIGRAREWTHALTRWCASQPDMVPYRGECLVHRAEIISLQGVWREALDEALLACERLSEPPGQPAYGAAVYQIAELHRLRGDLEKAEEAYRKSSESGRSPYPGLALLRLAQGRREDAVASMRRILEEARHRRNRSKILAAAVEIMLAARDVVAARQAADELHTMARTLNTPFLRAVAAASESAVLLAEGNPSEALAASRTAWSLWRGLDVPYEAARAQVVIGQACRALGDKDSANFELEAARQAFEHLGARPDAARLAEIAEVERPAAGLTARELQVLRLVATGRTNRAIAGDLAVSEKTVARHVANIFHKLNVSSRAAATAYAFEHRLTEPSA
jgi:DNA-binding CsgD family transcriptional regulator